ncbi:MAG: nickel pincer cofactor biosynthesis protein LarB [Bacteroidota bacterium]
MDRTRLEALLQEVRDGHLAIPEALETLSRLPYHDLGFARVDSHRALRTGFAEVIYGEGKTPEQIEAIFGHLVQHHEKILVTRIGEAVAKRLTDRFEGAEYHPRSRLVTFGYAPPMGEKKLAVLAAGTADLGVAEEAAITAEMRGAAVHRAYDVGVAGIHRLFDQLEVLRTMDALVVVAGMEGALASVVSGLVSRPVIAVPTSVGYGASFGGLAALLAMLNSCAEGVAVVNIDNGFGAGTLAAMIVEKKG